MEKYWLHFEVLTCFDIFSQKKFGWMIVPKWLPTIRIDWTGESFKFFFDYIWSSVIIATFGGLSLLKSLTRAVKYDIKSYYPPNPDRKREAD
jgi:hypothetical protein